MKSLGNSRMNLILLGYSALVSCLVIVFYNFAYSGIAISLASFASLVYIFKSEKSKFSSILYFLILFLSFFIFYRASEFLTFLNIVSIFFLGSLMAMPKDFFRNTFGFLHFLTTPVLLFFRSILIKSEYDVDLRPLLKTKIKLGKAKTIEVFVSIAVSIVLLIIIIPLLASANPIFSKYLNDIFNLLKLEGFFKWLSGDNIVVWVFRLIAFGIFAFFIPRLLTYVEKWQEAGLVPSLSLSFVNFNLPKALTSIVLFIFFLTQIQLYLSPSDTLLSMGISHADFTREVFAQLSVVALIILGLVYNDRDKKTLAKILTLILVFEGIFLSFIALKSVYDYSMYWGFTHKRLWGFTVVFWTLGVFSFFIYKYLKDIQNTVFVKGVIIFSGFVLVGVNILNFDYLIFKYRKNVSGRGVDYLFMSGLSSDSGSFGEQFQFLEGNIAKIDKNESKFNRYSYAGQRLLRKIRGLQEKYGNLDLRTFNVSEYLQYKEVQSIDTEKYMSLWAPVPPRMPLIPGDESGIIIREDTP